VPRAALRLSIRDRRGLAVVLASAALHAAVLGAWALHAPHSPGLAELPAMTVSLVPAPVFAHPPATAAAAPQPRPSPTRVIRTDQVAPRYAAAAEAPTGDAGDAVDLFGPVFADGLWPRPVRVGRAPCDADEISRRGADCQRDLMVIGLASDAVARSNAGP
jgi:hypothetical protein